MITPLIILFTIWIDKSKIEYLNNSDYRQKYGSLFEEFYTNNSMSKYLYYSVFTMRNLIFGMSQIYLNDYEYWQKGLNLAASLFLLIYLLKFTCFKEKINFISNIVSELFNCFLFFIVLCKSFIKSFKEGEKFDYFFISLVFIQISIQYGVCLYCFVIQSRKYYKEWKNSDKSN